ncbi:PAS domain S-box protein [Caulobacter sp. BE254]|uniref:PAS domain-containing sensor histidine kinase n=1 Tax=Caulobacter sp. BE254 TaxID=2817720 RepID=UPI00285D1ADE|nr:PAS domain S-box protein [Caulobacter sp. BE254]MDR7115557.1 PAS domain S-box-containing protein [Caulobacter sp. BE254]
MWRRRASRPRQPKDQILEQLYSDIERLSLLPETWKGLDPTSIAEGVLDTLLDMLALDFVGLRFNDTTHIFLRVAPAFGDTCSAEAIRAALETWSATGAPEVMRTLSEGSMSVVQCPLGENASIGVILAGARRAAFPDRMELSKLRLAASQAGLACREMRDLSDRQPPADFRDKPLSEAALAESEWRLHLTINTIPTMAWSTTPDGLIDFCNQNFVDYVGWTAEEISGQGFWPIFHPDDTAHLLASWQEILATKRPRDVEGRIRRADGQYRWFVLRQNPLFDADGAVIKWYGAGADIEDRKRAETALEETQAALLASEQNLNLIINSLPVLVWSARPDGSADFINHSWREYAGEPADKILEWGFLDLYHPDDVAGMVEIWKRDLAHSDQTSLKGRIRGADGQYRWFYFAGRKLTDANGVVRWFGCNVDIEDLQRAEDALRASEAALRESERALSLMLDAIPAMAWSTTADGYADMFNKSMVDYLGRSMEELAGVGFLAQFHPDDVDRMLAEWQAMMASGAGGDIEGRSQRADGEYRWLICRCSPLLNAQGEVVRWYGVNLDIEDRKRAEAATQASESNLSLILNSLPVLIWSAKAGGSADFINQRYLDYVGLPTEAILDFGFADVIHPDDVDGLLETWRLAQDQDTSFAQARIRRFDGEYRWFYLIGQKFYDANGTVRWFGVNIDVEDHKDTRDALRASEAALRESERQLQQIVSSIPGLTWSSDERGATTFWSRQYLDYAGAKLEDVLGFGFVDYIHPDDREHAMDTWATTLTSGRPGEAELRLRRADGVYRWFLIRACPFFDEAGNLTQWFGVNVDIEDRKGAQDALQASEAALRESERQLQQIVSSIPGLTWKADAQGNVTFWSKGFLDYGGATIEDIVGYGFMNYLHPDDHDRVMEVWNGILQSGTQGESEVRIRRADGQYRWFLWRASPFFDGAGNVTQWFGINVDIENRKRAEENLRQSQNELAHVTRMTTMGELAVSIAHEVNQPLMAVVTNAGACLRWLNGDPPDLAMARQAAERIVRDGHRAGDIITSLRNLARKSAPRLDRVCLDQVIPVVLDLLQGEFRRHGVVAKAELGDFSITIRGDSTQLQQVVLNLVMNAVEAMASAAASVRRLTVSAEIRDGDALVTVADTGPGLGTEDPDRLFEAFFSTKTEGIGMGLSICRSIIEAHGGRIWASNGARGGVFSFTLPLAEGYGFDVSNG